MRDEDVAAYLENHPEFYEKYAEMLAGVSIPHPYGGRTISLSERQLLTLREPAQRPLPRQRTGLGHFEQGVLRPPRARRNRISGTGRRTRRATARWARTLPPAAARRVAARTGRR